jgi:uncharacterized protein (DUF433 family)
MIDVHTRTSDLSLTAFTADLAAKITGLSVSQLHRWDRTGFFQPSLGDPDRRRPCGKIYSLRDVIALRAIAKVRAAGVPFSEIAKLRDELAPAANGEYRIRFFHIVGKHMFVSSSEALAVAKSRGLPGVSATIDIDAVIAEVEEGVRRLSERTPDQIGQITSNRWIMSGVPIIAGTRIPTATISWFHDNGYTLAEILENFPRLTAIDVDAAVAFERDGEAQTREPILAHG